MFEVKWFLKKSEKEMNADKILPIDLYHAVSMNCCLWNRELLL